MNDQANDYVRDIGVPQVFVERLDKLAHIAAYVCPEPIEDTFLSNIVDQDNKDVYDSAWFFSKNYALEAKEFSKTAKKYMIDQLSIGDGVAYWEIEMEAFDLIDPPSHASRLKFTFLKQNSTMSQGGILVASGRNCAFLAGILTKYFAIGGSR